MGERGGRQPANSFPGIQPTCSEPPRPPDSAHTQDSKQGGARVRARARA